MYKVYVNNLKFHEEKKNYPSYEDHLLLNMYVIPKRWSWLLLQSSDAALIWIINNLA